MKILFLHGWHSVVGGVKPTYLSNAGHTVINPSLDDDDFGLAVRTAQAEYDQRQPDVIVGSSRGGAIAMNIDSKNTPLVLLCPAWKNWGTAKSIKSNSMILHSRQDDVIPFDDSVELLQNSDLPPETLVEVGEDHRLADPESLPVMLWICNMLVSGQKLSCLDDAGRSNTVSAGRSKSVSQVDASYICDACGEEIVIPLDLSEGSSQEYVEDCPVCCRANIIHIHMDDEGELQIWAEPEQDHD